MNHNTLKAHLIKTLHLTPREADMEIAEINEMVNNKDISKEDMLNMLIEDYIMSEEDALNTMREFSL
jgi:hypothetical protein